MGLEGNTILITGATSGIGWALAERFLATGNKVIICGRREDRLREKKEQYSENLYTRACDISVEAERVALYDWAAESFPELNVLVNNAGIQRRVRIDKQEPWADTRSEIATNFDAPVHLTQLFMPLLMKQDSSALINVTSGLSFAPLANVPVYCATKAALHSFTLSLRYQLKDTQVRVIEIVPPAVNTDLGGVGLHDFGVDLDEFTDATFARMKAGETEIAYGSAIKSSRASREELDGIFQYMNSNFKS